jgi:hypothetical protein
VLPTAPGRRRFLEFARAMRCYEKCLRPRFDPSDEAYTFLIRLERKMEPYPDA